MISKVSRDKDIDAVIERRDNNSRLDRNEGASESRAMHGPTPNLAIDFERRDSFSLPRGRSSSLRRQSISLNAVINHRRALIGYKFCYIFLFNTPNSSFNRISFFCLGLFFD